MDAAYYLTGPADAARLVTMVACGVALWRPSPRVFGVVFAMSIVDWLVASPVTTNHGFTTLVGSALFLVIGAHGAPAPDRPHPGAVAMPLIAAVYAGSVLQKLNTAYLSGTDASCAVALWDQFANLPTGFAAALPALSLGIEAGIGLGMLSHRTRGPAAFCGALFHLGVGSNPASPIYLFSMTMIALYAAAWSTGPPLLPAVARVAFVGGVIVPPLARVAGLEIAAGILGWACWLVVIPFALHLFARFRPAHPAEHRVPSRSLPSAVVGLALLNTVPAHTGDRQGNSYDMYSNLLVDERGSNHLFLPSLARARPFSARVRVLEAEPPGAFVMSTNFGQRVARVELVRVLRAGGVDRVVWTDGAGEHTWHRGDPLPDEGITWWHLKSRRLLNWPGEPSCVDCQTCQVLRGPGA